MAFSQLAGKMGLPEKKVVKDLQKMIEKGYFGGKAYLNMELGYLFRSNEADAEMERRRREAEQCAQTPKETEEGYSGILRSIRRANDQIADPVLSEKISRLEDITAKIFRAVEEDPKKQKKIDKLLNYYLPTTQKLLDAYAEFERTGIEGENLRQAKERIQNTMDAIIAGFEHQLDELYQADVMDVDSDIRVMVGGRRNQCHTGSGAAGFGDPGIDFCAGQMAALAGFGPLGHLDLDLLGTGEVFAGHTEAAGGHLLDGGAALVPQTLLILAALAGVGLAADAVHDLAVQRLFNLRGGNGHVLHLSEDIRKLHPDELDVLLTDNADDFLPGIFAQHSVELLSVGGFSLFAALLWKIRL